jgi:glyoxylase-like metal-dependent hydrolase (beta-lactamase superfamily II)
LEAGAGVIAGMSVGMPAMRPSVAHAQSGATRLTDDLHVLAFGGVNAVAMTTAEGAVLVDGGSPSSARDVLQAVAELSPGGIHTLVNTHWHPEQTGANEYLGREGVRIVAHENTRLWLTTDITYPWDGRTFEPLPEAARPNTTFYDRDEMTVGTRHVEYGYLRHAAHTDGDLYVRFMDSNVLVAGDAVSGAGWPLIDWWTGGWIGGVVGGLELLLSLSNTETRIVPARGPVMSRADLELQYVMYSTIYERLSRLLNSGRGPDEAVADEPTAEFDATMGPSDEFVRRSFESLWAYLSPDA